MAQSDRDILFANESFLIGVLQAVSGGSLVAAISQSEPLTKLAGRIPLLIFLSAAGLALMCAVLSAYWKHQYKMWDLKAQVSVTKSDDAAAAERSTFSTFHLVAMRRGMLASLISLLLGFVVLLTAMWVRVFCQTCAA